MGEDNKAAEAVQAAAEAIEAVEGAADGDKKASKIQKVTSLALAIGAVVTSIGAFLKTCDHSVTESAYDTLAQSITKLSDNQEKLGQDVANLHGYLEGLRQAQGPTIVWADAGVTVLPEPPMPPPTPPLPRRPAKPFKPVPTATSSLSFDFTQLDLDAGVLAYAPAAPAAPAPVLPPTNAPPAKVVPPPFNDIK